MKGERKRLMSRAVVNVPQKKLSYSTTSSLDYFYLATIVEALFFH